MPEQVQKQKQSTKTEEVVEEELEVKTTNEEEVLEYTDDLLDEIDGLLEENAATFVKEFVQKGGE